MTPLGAIVLVAVSVAAIWIMLVAILWLHRPTRMLAMPVLRLIPDVIVLSRRLLTDRRLPAGPRIALVGLLGWLLMPVDLIPDFLPGIGLLDDVIVIALVLRWVTRRLGVEALAEHWPGPLEGFAVLRRLIG